MFRTVLLSCCLALSFTSSTWARSLTFEEKQSDLNQLVSLIKSGYGPLQYKARYLGMDIDRLQETTLQKIKATKTNGEFYYLLVQFVSEFRDSHFGASIPTTYRATLPFSTDLVEGKVLIDEINRKKVNEANFPFARGDEILEVDETPISVVLDELEKFRGEGFAGTSRRIAALLVSVRPGRILPVPNGEVILKIRHGNSAIIDTVKLNWEITGEPVDEALLPPEPLALGLGLPPANYDLLSTQDKWKDLLGPRFERSYMCSGETRIAIPKDATVMMTEPFVAYYHPTEKGNVGYLRIPHYYPQSAGGESEFDLRFAQYEYALSVLEKNTVGLIIDQDHNCGGSVSYLHRILGLFMAKPFQPMQFQLLANKEEYLQFQSWVQETPPHTIEHQGLVGVLDLIKKSWMGGEFLTPKTSLLGDTEIHPNPIRYTKPIVMLIDELSGSGGDAFPSLMQGYGRATLLGTRTMGAGGHVQSQPDLFYSRITLSMTKSLFFRPDGVAVENNGATPDAPYTITRDDFLYGYRGYQDFYLRELLKKVK